MFTYFKVQPMFKTPKANKLKKEELLALIQSQFDFTHP